jgi:hypothetical protein
LPAVLLGDGLKADHGRGVARGVVEIEPCGCPADAYCG